MSCSILFLGAYIFYTVHYIFPYILAFYYDWILPLVGEPIKPDVVVWLLFLAAIEGPPELEYRYIFSRSLYPYLHHLAEKVTYLKRTRAESDNWNDEVWRKNDTDNDLVEHEGSVEELCRHWLEYWELNHERDFSWAAFLAVFFLGEKSFKQTRENLENDNMEPIRRWSMITGKEIPTW
jgi:hypothetical protein